MTDDQMQHLTTLLERQFGRYWLIQTGYFVLLALLFLFTGCTPAETAAQSSEVARVAGGGNGDGGPCASAVLDPKGIDAKGDILGAADNRAGQRSFRLCNLATDTINTAGPKTFSNPVDVAVTTASRGYLVDGVGNRVHLVMGGTSTVLAGTGSPGYSGDGGLATSAQLNLPQGVFVESDGSVLIADFGNHRVRRVATVGGPIETLIDLPALARPTDVIRHSDGNYYVTDNASHVVWRVTPAGKQDRVAGTGQPGYAGDGGPSWAATLNRPLRLVEVPGGIVIADSENCALRKLHMPALTISTLIGKPGQCTNTGDGGPASAATLARPLGVAYRNGVVYFSAGDLIRSLSLGGIVVPTTLPHTPTQAATRTPTRMATATQTAIPTRTGCFVIPCPG